MYSTKLVRALFFGVVSLAAFTTFVSSARATRLSITSSALSSARGILTLSASGLTTTCDVTLGIVFVRSTAKTVGSTIASILPSGAGSAASPCSAVIIRFTILSGITLGYQSFSGTLPNISGVGARVNSGTPGLLIQYTFAGCLYSASNVSATFTRSTSSGAVPSLAISSTGLTTVATLSGTCPPNQIVSGTLAFVAPQPVITLI